MGTIESPAAEKALIQLHWQDPANHERTEFVAQTGYSGPDDMYGWAQEIIARRGHEKPDGWVPMICTWESHYFVKCPPADAG